MRIELELTISYFMIRDFFFLFIYMLAGGNAMEQASETSLPGSSPSSQPSLLTHQPTMIMDFTS